MADTATLTVRRVETSVRDRLRVRAARNGRSMEAELRVIIEAAVAEPVDAEDDIAEGIRRLFAPLGGLDDLVLPPRGMGRNSPTFD